MLHHQQSLLCAQGSCAGKHHHKGDGQTLTSESWSFQKLFSGMMFTVWASSMSTGRRMFGCAGSSPRTQCCGSCSASALYLPRVRARLAPRDRASFFTRRRSGGGEGDGDDEHTSRHKGLPSVSGMQSAGHAARRASRAEAARMRPPLAFLPMVCAGSTAGMAP